MINHAALGILSIETTRICSTEDDCPEICTSEQQTCWVANYDASGGAELAAELAAELGGPVDSMDGEIQLKKKMCFLQLRVDPFDRFSFHHKIKCLCSQLRSCAECRFLLEWH